MPIIDDAWRDLSAFERDVLVALAVGGPGMGRELHRRVVGPNYNTETTTTRALKRMINDGYAVRHKSEEDARAYQYELTQEGRELVRRAIIDRAQSIAY